MGARLKRNAAKRPSRLRPSRPCRAGAAGRATWSGLQPIQYPDPDNRFRRYIAGNTAIKRLYTGTLRAEGPGLPSLYRVDPKAGRIEKVADELDQPNGVCFSPDYRKFNIADTGAAGGETRVYDLDGESRQRETGLSSWMCPGLPGKTRGAAAERIRCDVDGNAWCGDSPGVQVVTPGGDRIGVIRLSETFANISFGGVKCNRLPASRFMLCM
jgi:sugar lactone lactonase YvrE